MWGLTTQRLAGSLALTSAAGVPAAIMGMGGCRLRGLASKVGTNSDTFCARASMSERGTQCLPARPTNAIFEQSLLQGCCRGEGASAGSAGPAGWSSKQPQLANLLRPFPHPQAEPVTAEPVAAEPLAADIEFELDR